MECKGLWLGVGCRAGRRLAQSEVLQSTEFLRPCTAELCSAPAPVAGAFDNIVSEVPYRRARTVDDALAEIRRCSGTQFDPKVVTAFLDWLEIYDDAHKQQ